MENKKNANLLSGIRGLFDGDMGHNYGLPDCLAFIWERAEGTDKPDFWDFASLTGDTVAQVYNRNPSTQCEYCVSGYLAGPEHIGYVFDAIGYGHTYVTAEQISSDKQMYLNKVMAYIDQGLPVLVKSNMNDVPGWKGDVGTYCLAVGYADGGQTLLLIFDNSPYLLRYDMSGMAAKNVTPVGKWPLPAGMYDPGLDGCGIPDGVQLIGLFDRSYRKIAAPSAVKGFSRAASIESLTAGQYYVLNTASGFRYVLISGGDAVPEMESVAVDLIFIGEKQRAVSLEELYINALKKMTYWLTLPEQGGMCFGASAYRAWADDLEAGRYLDARYDVKGKRWDDYGVYVVNLATSGGLPSFLIKKLIAINPEYSGLAPLYDTLNALMNDNDVELWPKLIKLGADMDDSIDALRDQTKRLEITALFRDYAERLDKAVALLRDGLR